MKIADQINDNPSFPVTDDNYIDHVANGTEGDFVPSYMRGYPGTTSTARREFRAWRNRYRYLPECLCVLIGLILAIFGLLQLAIAIGGTILLLALLISSLREDRRASKRVSGLWIPKAARTR